MLSEESKACMEVVFNSVMDVRVREIIDLILIIENAIQTKEPCKEMYSALENTISMIEQMSNNSFYEES